MAITSTHDKKQHERDVARLKEYYHIGDRVVYEESAWVPLPQPISVLDYGDPARLKHRAMYPRTEQECFFTPPKSETNEQP